MGGLIMGSLHSMESAEMVKNGEITLDDAIRWHLTGNIYPPVHTSFIPVAKKAIKLCQQSINEDDEELYKTKIKMPNGKVLTAAEIVQKLHLEFFLEGLYHEH